MDILKRAHDALSVKLTDRTMADLEELESCARCIRLLIPKTKRHMRSLEIDADTLEKQTIIDIKKKKISQGSKMTQDDIKAYARLEKNKKDKETLEIEEQYLTLYAYSESLSEAVINTRMLIKSI